VGGFGPNRQDILASRIEAPERLEPALIRPGHIECPDQPEAIETLYDRLPCAVIDELDNGLRAWLHADIISDTGRDENLFWTRRPHLACSGEKRHTQHDLRRLAINLVEVDVIISREIEAPVDTQHTGPSTEVFLLLLVAKHQKRSVDSDIATEPAVGRFRGPYVAQFSDRACQGIDLVVSDPGQLDDESCGTCSLIAGQHFVLAKLNLAREKCDGEDCRSDCQRRQARPQPGLAQIGEGEPQKPAVHGAASAARAQCPRAIPPAYPRP